MPAVTRVKTRPATPAVYEYNDKGTATEAIAVGELIVLGASGVSKAPAGTPDAHGICLIPSQRAGDLVEYGLQGEMDGFALPGGVNPGAPLYPSATVAGGVDTTKPVQAAPAAGADLPAAIVVRMRAVTGSRIRFNFV